MCQTVQIPKCWQVAPSTSGTEQMCSVLC
jgi:hypothetical protein